MTATLPRMACLAAFAAGLALIPGAGALAGPEVLAATGVVTVGAGAGSTLGAIYSQSPGQTEYDSVMRFDMSAYAGNSLSNGSLQLTVSSVIPSGGVVMTTLSLFRLTAAYDPNTVTLASLQALGGGYPGPGQLIDSQPIGALPGIIVDFTIPADLLAEWANAPASNYGVIMIQSATFSNTGVEVHSDIAFESTANLTFEVPEPASMAVLGMGLLGLWYRRRSAA